MHQIQVSDGLFESLQRRAAASGFESVNEYVVDLLENDLSETFDPDRFFTPARLAEIDAAVAEADAGLLLTSDQVQQQLAVLRQAWLDKQKS